MNLHKTLKMFLDPISWVEMPVLPSPADAHELSASVQKCCRSRISYHFNYIKSKHFHTRCDTLAFTFIRCIRHLVAQELDNRNHVSYARNFCRRPTSEVDIFEQNRYSASIERVGVYQNHVNIA